MGLCYFVDFPYFLIVVVVLAFLIYLKIFEFFSIIYFLVKIHQFLFSLFYSRPSYLIYLLNFVNLFVLICLFLALISLFLLYWSLFGALFNFLFYIFVFLYFFLYMFIFLIYVWYFFFNIIFFFFKYLY
jgi:hypothetical protein